jgi:DNA topoisomerase-6 subunit B
MASFQSQLDETDIADELAQGQRAISVAEFFEKNKHMLGFDSDARALVTAVKEGVDNSLDATEEAGFLPDIYVEIREDGDYYNLVIEDNGPGITKEQIPKIFGKMLYGSRFGVRSQARGQQGLGISAAVLYAQLTSGAPAKITSRTPKSEVANYYELIIDTDDNEPEIQREDTTTWDRPHGTRIELRLEANMRARQQLHDYITHTAIVNPHARIELIEPDAEFKFDRATDELPAETSSIRPHPHGVELGTLIKMLNATDSYSLSGFLQGEFTRVGATTAENILDAFRDRHFGREVAWGPPRRVEDVDLARSVQQAVANKSADATAAFAERVADAVAEAGTVPHHELEAIVGETADAIEAEFDQQFGSTVREKAVAAGWAALTADRVTPLFDRVRAATSSRKDDEAVRAFVERFAPKFDEGERDRVTREQLVEFVDRAAEKAAEYSDVTFGETSRENVVEAIWDGMRRVPDELPSVNSVAGDRDAAADLLAGMRAIDVMAPPTDCLSPISAELIEEGLRKEVDADYYTAVTRDAEVHGGDPFIVEAGIAFGGELQEESTADLLRFANRVPLVYQQGACAITDVVRGIDWRNYGLDQPGGSGMPSGPAKILVHVASTNVPFTSESKDAVANIPAIEKQVELAVREASRGMKSHLNKRRSLQQRREKQSVIADILPKMAAKVASVTSRDTPNVDESLARIMNNVLVAREANGDQVELVVENNTDAGVDLELSEVLDAEPGEPSAGRVVELDGEWVVKWNVTVGSGESESLSYDLDADAESDLTVDGPEPEKLTIQP